MQNNPFTYGKPIIKTSRFSGRSVELNRIYSKFQQMCSVSIVGERRVGKSSLLRLSTLSEFRQKFDVGKDFVLCFADLQGMKEDIETNQFWKWILEEVSEQLPKDLCTEVQQVIKGNQFDFFTLRPLFEKLRSKKIVFIFDEFETILQNPIFTESFYGLLRYLAENCSVAFITATRKELVYHCIDDETKTSPFFNIFDTLILRPFQASECQELVTTYLKDSEVQFTEQELTQLMELSGSYPAFFQMGCSFLFDAYTDEMKKHDVDLRWSYVDENFRIQMNSHAEYFWSRSEEEERILLALLALLSEKGNKAIPETRINKLYPRYKNDLLTLYSRSLFLILLIRFHNLKDRGNC